MKIDPEGLGELCDRHGITKLRLFGSLARGEGDEASDLGLLVGFEQRKSLLVLLRIERESFEHFEREVDLLTERALSPCLRDRIVVEARVAYERAA